MKMFVILPEKIGADAKVCLFKDDDYICYYTYDKKFRLYEIKTRQKKSINQAIHYKNKIIFIDLFGYIHLNKNIKFHCWCPPHDILLTIYENNPYIISESADQHTVYFYKFGKCNYPPAHTLDKYKFDQYNEKLGCSLKSRDHLVCKITENCFLMNKTVVNKNQNLTTTWHIDLAHLFRQNYLIIMLCFKTYKVKLPRRFILNMFLPIIE